MLFPHKKKEVLFRHKKKKQGIYRLLRFEMSNMATASDNSGRFIANLQGGIGVDDTLFASEVGRIVVDIPPDVVCLTLKVSVNGGLPSNLRHAVEPLLRLLDQGVRDFGVFPTFKWWE